MPHIRIRDAAAFLGVAIAQALAAGLGLILLDEPLAVFDVGAAPLLRRVFRRVPGERSAGDRRPLAERGVGPRPRFSPVAGLRSWADG
jgi:hypothetical protein